MKVFVSWSGDRSRRFAALLRKYLPCIIQNLDVFVSEHDIESGARWATRITMELDQSHFGILCLTPENITSPWLLFEAGALTKHLDGKACGVLLAGLTAKDISGPLTQFQHRTFAARDFLKMLCDLNRLLATPLEEGQVELIHGKWWSDLEAEYQKLSNEPVEHPVATRSSPEILEELVQGVRGLQRSVAELGETHSEAVFSNRRGVVTKGAILNLVTRLTRVLPIAERELLKQVAVAKLNRDEDAVLSAVTVAPEHFNSLVLRGLLWKDDNGAVKINAAVAHVLAGGGRLTQV